jgi:rifampicin phosphotransferase
VLPDRWLTDWPVSDRFPLYTRANAGEVMPDPVSPLGWTLVWEAACVPGWCDSMIETGNFEPDEITPRTPVGMFGGYLFISATASRLFGVRTPGLSSEIIDHVYFGEHPEVPPYVPEPWHENPRATERLGAWMGGVLTAGDLPELRDDRSEAATVRSERVDLRTLGDAELVARARSLIPFMRRLFCRHLLVTAASSIGPGVLQGIAAELGDPAMALRLVSSIGGVDSAAPSQAMWELSREIRGSAALGAVFDEAVRDRAGFDGVPGRIAASDDPAAGVFRRAFDAFLVEFGSRGPNEWDIRSDVWETRPGLALALIDRMRFQGDDDAPSVRNALRAADREALTDRIDAALADRPELLGQFRLGLRSAHVHLAGRERTKTTIIRVLHEQRMAVRELGARHGFALSAITMLLDDELDAFVSSPDDFRARLAAREQQYLELFELEPPFIVNGSVAPVHSWPRRSRGPATAAAVGDVLVGVSGCPGSATGRARVILDPADPTALEPGDVLIAPFTDPSWTPLFVPAAAVVVDVGAQVSHAVIVSRELGIPCAVSVKDATRRIPDGALVRVDGDAGTVTILDIPR